VIGKNRTEAEVLEIDLGEAALGYALDGKFHRIEWHDPVPESEFARHYSALFEPPHKIARSACRN
jgi:hypothetical protein